MRIFLTNTPLYICCGRALNGISVSNSVIKSSYEDAVLDCCLNLCYLECCIILLCLKAGKARFFKDIYAQTVYVNINTFFDIQVLLFSGACLLKIISQNLPSVKSVW